MSVSVNRWTSRHRLMASIACTALSSVPAFAQQPASQPIPLGPVRVEDNSLDKGYIAKSSTTATKTETPLIDIPQSITVVTQKEMQDRGVSNLQDATRYVPGVVFTQGEGNRDNPVFRGNSGGGDLFLDGVRDDAEYYRDVYNIDRVEVLKGPNAMIFGRGAAGGLINRVTRMADWSEKRQVHVEGGSYGDFRGTFDVDQPVSDDLALRLTGLYMRADSYRNGVNFERYGLNPTATFLLTPNTTIRAGYEHFYDHRVGDRGVSSFNGVPLKTNGSTFFGDPTQSPNRAYVNNVTLDIEHLFSDSLVLRNKTRYADYDKLYQNVYPGTVNAAGTTVQILAYNNAMRRKNVFNQTDLNWTVEAAGMRHTLLLGTEFGRQETDNLRHSGTFGGATSINVPISNPTVSVPVVFAINATDGNNHGVADIAAFYAQDQIELSPQWQFVGGVRYDDFHVNFLDRRGTGTRIRTSDAMWSPRAGLIYKPQDDMSLYASYSLTFVPRAGAQLASLSVAPTAAGNAAAGPEKFTNYEVGVKWNILPDLDFTGSLYFLDRTNVIVPDPVIAGQYILIDGQNTKGTELSLTGQITPDWTIVGGYSYALGKARTTATGPYTRLGGLPEHTFSLWNRYDFNSALGAAVGIIYQSSRFTSTTNTVSLAPYTRLDAALFYKINEMFTAQINIENIFDTDYFEFANSNTNITPAAPRLIKVSLTTSL
ncbi:MAG: TonB-dependent siderophore receptor [Alphaproteobacteria bacterium]|nr:TonB-dependent siderophore receptor [Alphaproteobacteria bacterium]